MFSYLHIPFCRQKCHYCKFALTSVFNDAKIELYLAHLKAEIRGFFEETPLPPLSGGQDSTPLIRGVPEGRGVLQSIYFGGGTPSILSPKQIIEIIELFRSLTPLAPDMEITLEANPEDITPTYARELKSTGITRLSLGVQTLNPASLKEIGRSDPETIYRALDAIFEAGFQNVNTDFILGLPHVLPGDIEANIRTLLDRYPLAHTSAYLLEEENYPAHWKTLSMDASTLQKDHLSIRELLTSRGFLNYEISNFALPGYESRHNRGYWDHSDTRGFWLSAASHIRGRRFANSPSFAGYYRGELAYTENLTQEARRIERCMFGLRTSGIDISDIRNHEKLEGFMQNNLVKKRDGKIFPTSAWIFLIDHIIGELI